MLRTLLLDFLTIVGGAVGIGLALDAIFVGPVQQKAIRAFLHRPHPENGANKTLYDYVEIINVILFERYFRMRFFSMRYVASSFSLSLLFVGVIFAVQYFVSPQAFANIRWSAPQVFLLVACIAGNLIVDWISIGVTQLVFELIVKVRRFWQSFALMVIDFFMTVNVFTIIYSATLAAIVIFLHLTNARGDFLALTIVKSIEVDKGDASWTYDQEIRKFLGSKYYFYSIYSDRTPLSAGYTQQKFQVQNPVEFFSTSSDIDLKDLFAIGSKVQGYPSVTDFENVYGNVGSSFIQEVSISSGAESRNESFARAQAVTFDAVEQVQQSFPDSISLRAKFLMMEGLMSSYAVMKGAPVDGASVFVFACEEKRGNTRNWRIEAFDAFGQNACLRRVAAFQGVFSSLPAIASAAALEPSGMVVPLNSVFMSSLVMTFFIYGLTAVLFFSRFLISRLKGRGRFLTTLFGRAPFAALGLLSGCLGFILLR